MKLKPYSAYRDSGVEWLGRVPTSWEIQPLKYSFQIVGGSTPKSEITSFWDGEIIWVTPSDLSKVQGLVIDDSQRKITSEGLSSIGARLFPAGSIILSTRAPIGSLAIAKREMCTNQGCKALIPNTSTNPMYCAYLLSISTEALSARGKGTTFLELSGDELGFFRTPSPSSKEQTIIAAFLDRETTKLDILISKQERLIELLQEKRQAIISHAVTKGLNPDVPMKDSGIEWLGEVPAHWEVSSFKRIINIQNGADHKHIEVEDLDSGYPVVGSGGIFAYASGYMFDGPSVLLGRKGTIDKPLFLNCKFWTVDTMYWSKIRDGYDPKFAYYVALNIPFDYYSTSTALPSMTKSLLGSHIVAIPNLVEQIQISNYLDDQNAKIDILIDKARKSIELAKEHRAALISAAVTGKIDVREAT